MELTVRTAEQMMAMRCESLVQRVAPYSSGLATFVSICLIRAPHRLDDWERSKSPLPNRANFTAIDIRDAGVVEQLRNGHFRVVRQSVEEPLLSSDAHLHPDQIVTHDSFSIDLLESALPILGAWGAPFDAFRYDFQVEDCPF